MQWREVIICVTLTLLFVEFRTHCCHPPRADVLQYRSFAVPEFQRIKGRHKAMVDEFGRERIFHGFNSVEKKPPWYDHQILNTTRLKYYQEWGFNAVRLGTMWSGVQPARNSVNQTYIAILQQIMAVLKRHGMYTLMDMHQDILTSKYNSYDGVPRWLIDSFPEPEHPFPWPLNRHCGEGDFHGYLSQAVSEGFQYFYNDYNGARGLFANFWKLMASTFKNDKNVLGYELINEPWVGDVYKEPLLFMPGISGERNLVPLYELTHNAIRSVDNETMIFFEPVTFGVLISSEVLGTGFSSVPGGIAYRDRSALSWHYYCWILGLDPAAFKKNDTSLQKLVCDEIFGPRVFNTIDDDMNNLRAPSFLTEFGNCAPDCDQCSVNTVECNFIMNMADQYKHSWTYWLSKFWLENGDVNWNTVRAFARAYPRATQGQIVKFSFNVTDGKFDMVYTINTTIKAPTEVFIPRLHYPKGHKVTATPGLQWTFDAAKSTLVVVPEPGLERDLQGKDVELHVRPAATYWRQDKRWYENMWLTLTQSVMDRL